MQAIDRMDIPNATGLPIVFRDGLPRNGQIVQTP
jgi:hypothetical protein